MKKYLMLFVLIILLVACGQSAEPAQEGLSPSTASTDNVELESEAATAVPEPTIAGAAVEETAVPPIQPIEVTYFTPSQQEGPYYTVEKPADRDNDLVDFAGANGTPLGQQLYLSGIVYNAKGLPVEGITIEIWQTDAAGAYLHPQDPATNSRDPNFQFYGESVTGPEGIYSFRTILPGLYEPRPRHIHVKVKRDGQELLTTQFYFAGEIDLQGDDAAMLIVTAPAENDAGDPILIGERDIILSIP